MSAYVWRDLGFSNCANRSQKYQIMPKSMQNIPLSIPRKTLSGHLPCLQSETGLKLKCLQKGRFCLQNPRFLANMFATAFVFFYAFLNIMGYVSGRIPDQRSYKIKNSVPSKKLDFTLFFASVKGFEPPAFRLGVYLGPGFTAPLLSQNPLFSVKRQVLLYVDFVLYYLVLYIRELPVCTFIAILKS